MIQFRGGFISGQTGDGCEKPETKIQESGESQESRKSGGTRKWKVKNYRFPMWFVNQGPCSSWFRANS